MLQKLFRSLDEHSVSERFRILKKIISTYNSMSAYNEAFLELTEFDQNQTQILDANAQDLIKNQLKTNQLKDSNERLLLSIGIWLLLQTADNLAAGHQDQASLSILQKTEQIINALGQQK